MTKKQVDQIKLLKECLKKQDILPVLDYAFYLTDLQLKIFTLIHQNRQL
jgi:hypothetical protein